jgi:hypothetical protein
MEVLVFAVRQKQDFTHLIHKIYASEAYAILIRIYMV